MGLLLSENDKLLILLVAFVLVIVTLILTSCLVLPRCYLYQRFVKSKTIKKEPSIVYPSFVSPESQHFHLSIVPVYGTQPESRSLASSPVKHPSIDVNQYENLTQLAEKTRMRYSSLKPDNLKALPLFPKVKARLTAEPLDELTFRLHILIDQVYDLKLKEYLCEPSCYVTVTLIGFKTQRKSIINKATQSEIFRTETVKRSLNPIFGKSFSSEILPISLLKEGCIKLRVMDEERYANDVCLGECQMSLKKIVQLGEQQKQQEAVQSIATDAKKDSVPAILVSVDKASIELSTYTLFPMKEAKGDIFVGFCYLPTSKRMAVTVVKATLRHSLPPTSNPTVHQAFYARILQFNNGRLMRKKKTSLSIRLLWGENETVSFDLNDEPCHLMSFMLVLCCKLQNSTTPSSPESLQESPQSPPETSNVNQATRNNSTSSSASRKDRLIGHFVLDKDLLVEEIMRRPRKQVLKWHKLY